MSCARRIPRRCRGCSAKPAPSTERLTRRSSRLLVGPAERPVVARTVRCPGVVPVLAGVGRLLPVPRLAVALLPVPRLAVPALLVRIGLAVATRVLRRVAGLAVLRL